MLETVQRKLPSKEKVTRNTGERKSESNKKLSEEKD